MAKTFSRILRFGRVMFLAGNRRWITIVTARRKSRIIPIRMANDSTLPCVQRKTRISETRARKKCSPCPSTPCQWWPASPPTTPHCSPTSSPPSRSWCCLANNTSASQKELWSPLVKYFCGHFCRISVIFRKKDFLGNGYCICWRLSPHFCGSFVRFWH